jgi:MoxR-like ATPase
LGTRKGVTLEMAKLGTPRLIDVEPTISGVATAIDRLTEASVLYDPLGQPSNFRLTVMSEAGALEGVIMLTLSTDGGRPVWADCSLAVAKDAGPEVTARLNRLLNGYTIQRIGMVSYRGKKYAPPKVGRYWRTKETSIFHDSHVVAAPAAIFGTPHVVGGAVGLRWRSTTPVFESNTVAGFTVIAAPTPAKASPRAAARGKKGKSASTVSPSVTVTPTIREAIGETDPSVTPSGSHEAPKTPATIPSPSLAVSPLPAGHPGIFRTLNPKSGMKVHVESSTRAALDAAFAGFMAGDRTSIILRGPSGAGKTITAEDLAARHGLPFWKVDVAGLRDFADWVGSVTLQTSEKGMQTGYTPSQFAEAVDAHGPYGGIPRLILLDEITRAETAGAMNALLPVLDGRGTLYVPDAHKSINIDPAVLFIGTANIGAGFTGTTVLDTAFVNRGTCWVIVDYPPTATERAILQEQGGIDATTATQLVNVASQIRKIAEIPYGVSTRQLVATARLIKHGLKPVDACIHAFVNTYDADGGADSDRAKVLAPVQAVLR